MCSRLSTLHGTVNGVLPCRRIWQGGNPRQAAGRPPPSRHCVSRGGGPQLQAGPCHAVSGEVPVKPAVLQVNMGPFDAVAGGL